MNNVSINKNNTKSRDVFSIPNIELYESDAINRLKGMKKYLEDFRKLPEEEAKKVAKENLMKSGIMDEDGLFTERYHYSRLAQMGVDISKL